MEHGASEVVIQSRVSDKQMKPLDADDALMSLKKARPIQVDPPGVRAVYAPATQPSPAQENVDGGTRPRSIDVKPEDPLNRSLVEVGHSARQLL